MPRISKELKEFKILLENEECINIEDLNDNELHLFINSFREEAEYLEDKRQYGYVIHSLEEILIVTILALLANCNNFVEIHLFAEQHYKRLKKYLDFSYGLPSISTFKRVIAIIKPNAMSAYSIKYDRCLVTEFIGDKTNEIPTAPKLLSRVNVKNVIFTFDALNTQKETIKYIANNNGYYVALVKENQKLLYENLQDYFNDKELLEKAKKENSYIELEQAYNKVEKKRIFLVMI